MAQSLHTIEVNYTKALQQAQKLEEVARKIETLTEEQCQACFHELSSNWKGDNADAFLKKGKRWNNDLKKSAKNLKDTGAAIREIAQRAYEAEKRAYEIAQIRIYNK